jgi:5-methylcytosine-specific restriction protein A
MRLCLVLGCSQFVGPGITRCPTHQLAHDRHDAAIRGNSNARGYTSAWRQERDAWLQSHPWCHHCQRAGRWVRGVIVHHVRAVRDGGPVLGAEKQSVCRSCHAALTAREILARAKR